MSGQGCYTQNVMSWQFYAVTVVHLVVCLILILVVLLQSGKAADLAGAFGGMGSQTVFGPRGTATVLSKATTVAAALFMITSLSLGILANSQVRSSGSVLENRTKKAPVQKTVPRTSLPMTAPAPVAPITAPTKK
jgi:preprotein translocase subunit SecG